MKRFFLTGLIVLLPFAISIFLFIWILDLLTDPFLALARGILLYLTENDPLILERHPHIAMALSRLLIISFLIGLTFCLGFLTRKYTFSYFFNKIQKIFLRIPFLRVVYKVSHDLAKVTFATDSSLFKETVLLPFPHKDALALGLITAECPPVLKKYVDIELSVFVPTAPHPISGFILFTPKKDVFQVELSTEDAFKFIISCGSTNPTPPQ
jgi:uncharacterized membrane protein